jgi:hypothetical protein
MTSYVVYCTTMSIVGQTALSVAEIEDTAQEVTTVCCKQMSVKMTTNSIMEDIPFPALLSISLDTVPYSDLNITLVVSPATAEASLNENVPDVIFSPESFVVFEGLATTFGSGTATTLQ